jgi:hypothetical protein
LKKRTGSRGVEEWRSGRVGEWRSRGVEQRSGGALFIELNNTLELRIFASCLLPPAPCLLK